MEKFHSEHDFVIKVSDKRKGDELTFSEGAWKLFIDAMYDWIKDEILNHWATKEISIHITLDGKYTPVPKKEGDSK